MSRIEFARYSWPWNFHIRWMNVRRPYVVKRMTTNRRSGITTVDAARMPYGWKPMALYHGVTPRREDRSELGIILANPDDANHFRFTGAIDLNDDGTPKENDQ